MIDLRSDTVTQPTQAMRQAMATAAVGDDVYGDDETTNTFQSVMAERTGKEAALFFPTGTQSNLAALLAHCQRGDEYIVGQLAHTYKYEAGGAAVLGSIQPQPLEHAEDGSLPIEKIRAAIKARDSHFARTRLIALENTFHGKVIDQGYIEQVAGLARERGLAIHLDGARVMNAAAATGKDVASLVLPFDSVSICFSKGLGAPIGSVLVGSKGFIEEARRWRKMVGGGMRQTGVLAAACHFALEHHVERLVEDHQRAEALAQALSGIDAVRVVGHATNMVFAEIADQSIGALTDYLRERNILISGAYGGPTRLVTHLGIGDDDIATVVKSIKKFFADR